MHIIYICSPDKKLEICTSLQSLLTSGTDFDKLTIFSVSNHRARWPRFKDPRFNIQHVEDIGQGFWMNNKTHLCDISDDDVCFIDTDTIIFRPLNEIWAHRTADVVGRTTSYYEHPKWPGLHWQRYLSQYGAAESFPYLNTGFLLFQNGAHRHLAERWKKITFDLLEDERFPFGDRSHCNQLAFSLTAASYRMSFDLMSPKDHAYGWAKEPFENTTLFHTGGPNFNYYAYKILGTTDILNKKAGEITRFVSWRFKMQRLKNTLKRYKSRGVRMISGISSQG